jgi:hypothetical protein
MNKIKILKHTGRLLFAIYLSLFILSIVGVAFADFLIINVIFPISGLLLIIFRKEACVIFRERRANVKEKHPVVWRLFCRGLMITEWFYILVGAFFLIFPLLKALVP